MPLLASVVPIVGAVGLWLVTGSVFALWFAALGPLIAGATVLDGMRSARKERRRTGRDAAEAQVRISAEIQRRHETERAELHTAHPDAAALAFADAGVWRAVPGRGEALVVGRGERPSVVRVDGADDNAALRVLRASAATVADAPVTVPTTGGVAVIGPPVLADAVLRALTLQLCLALPPGRLRIVGAMPEGWEWAASLPHRTATQGLALAFATPDVPLPAGADAVLARVDEGAHPPPGCAAVLTLEAIDRGQLDFEGHTQRLRVEALGADQAAAVVAGLVDRALALAGPSAASATVELRDVLVDAPRAHPGALPAVIGIENGAPAVVDLVADGPHAVVVGITGSGKSELLTTWITALCATHPTSAVNFLLADFKGGTAFDALGELPHVTGVLTDLDEAGARRAIESLRAEIRWREGALTRAGARDILDDRVDLPRLVVVVDEFATLVGAQPELHAVFTDVAARGRALGMHLILGSQRATGVFRDALLANCPLRLSLRVTDAADSRFVIGTDDAARLPGGAEGRGFAFVRRAGDAVPRPVRVAMSSAADRVRAADPGGSTGGSAAEVRRPWLPALPSRVDLDELSPATGPRMPGIVLGLADEPESQRQMPLVFPAHERGLVIVGGAGSGRSTAVAGIAAQIAGGRRLWIGPDPESAWDAVDALAHRAPQQGSMLLIDDLDALLPYFPLDYAQTFAERLERVVRGAGDAGIQIVLTAQRLTGATARIAELLPRRAVLAMPSRADFVAAGGTSALFDRDAPRGRADIGGVAVQLAMPASTVPRAGAPTVAATPWHPRGPITGVVTRAGGSLRDLESELRRSGVDVIAVEDGASALESGKRPTVVLGDPESWQRGWRTLMAVRIDHDLVIDAQCAADYRVLTGDRELPPYAHPSRQRAWLLRPGESPHRVELPHSDQRW